MRKFRNAIVKLPAKTIGDALTTADLGKPEYIKAAQQHREYVKALETCGLNVLVLDADEQYPDSCFVEDVALMNHSIAFILHPAEKSRRGETKSITKAVGVINPWVKTLDTDGTVEGGDILQAGHHFFIGLTKRTCRKGASDLSRLLSCYGYSSSAVEVKKGLHLKTFVSYLGDNHLLATKAYAKHPAFSKFNIIEVPEDEAYAANSIWVNDVVIIPKGYPETQRRLEKKGFSTMEVDVSEFRKADGGVSCLSLRF